MLLPAGAAAAALAEVPLPALSGRDLILFPRAAAPALYDELLTTCARGGFTPAAVRHGQGASFVQGLVLSSGAVALCPRDAARRGRGAGGGRRVASADRRGARAAALRGLAEGARRRRRAGVRGGGHARPAHGRRRGARRSGPSPASATRIGVLAVTDAVARIHAALADAGVTGWLHALDIDSGEQLDAGADQPVCTASVHKLCLLVTLHEQAARGALDLAEQVEAVPEGRTAGPTGGGGDAGRGPDVPARPGLSDDGGQRQRGRRSAAAPGGSGRGERDDGPAGPHPDAGRAHLRRDAGHRQGRTPGRTGRGRWPTRGW